MEHWVNDAAQNESWQEYADHSLEHDDVPSSGSLAALNPRKTN